MFALGLTIYLAVSSAVSFFLYSSSLGNNIVVCCGCSECHNSCNGCLWVQYFLDYPVTTGRNLLKKDLDNPRRPVKQNFTLNMDAQRTKLR